MLTHGDELEGVEGRHPVVVIPGQEQRGGVLPSGGRALGLGVPGPPHVVQRGVPVFFGDFRCCL